MYGVSGSLLDPLHSYGEALPLEGVFSLRALPDWFLFQGVPPSPIASLACLVYGGYHCKPSQPKGLTAISFGKLGHPDPLS